MLQDLYDGDGEVDSVLLGVVGNENSDTAMTGARKSVWLYNYFGRK